MPSDETKRDAELVGRGEKVDQLRQLVAAPGRLLTVTGPPGVGKTRLVRAVLAEDNEDDEQAPVVCEARGLEQPERLDERVARALEVDGGDGEGIGVALASREAPRLILDGVDGLVADWQPRQALHTRIDDWRERAPEATILMTARRRTGHPDEQIVEVPPLTVDDGVELFVETVRQIRADFELTDETRRSIRQLVDRLDGLPQAIVLAATRSRILGPDQLAERLDERADDRQVRGDGGNPAFLAPLTDALREVWQTLPRWARQASRQLAVMPGTFDAEAAEAVLDLPDVAPGPLDALEYLVDHSMVETSSTEAGRRMRFRMLATTRRFVGRQSEGDIDAARHRHLEYMAVRAERWLEARGGDHPDRVHRQVASALDRLRAAFDHALELGSPRAAILGVALIHHHTDCDQYEPAADILERLDETRLDDLSALDEAQLAYARTYLHTSQGDFEAAVDRGRRALDLAESAPAPILAGRIETVLAVAESVTGDLEAGLEALGSALERFREADNRTDEIKALTQFGRLYRAAGDDRAAEEYIREALDLARRHDLPTREMRARLHLGLLYAQLESFDRALEQLERAAELNDGLARWSRESMVPGLVAVVHHMVGRLERAEQLYRRSIEAKRREGAIGSLADALVDLGLLLLEREEVGQARQHFIEARRYIDESHSRSGFDAVGATRLGVGLSYLLEGRREAADGPLDDLAARVDELTCDDAAEQVLPAMAEHAYIVREAVDLREAIEAGEREASAAGEQMENLEDRLAETEAPEGLNVGFTATRRLADRAISGLDELVDTSNDPEQTGPAMRVGAESQWVELPDGDERIDLSNRGTLRRVLEALVSVHLADDEALSVYEILEAGWPNKPADPGSGKNRVYTTIARLRDLGLGELLETVEAGYRLSPELTVRRQSAEAPSTPD